MVKLHFNYKDMFRPFRVAFSAKKIWIMFLGLLVGTITYALFTYIAHIVAGTAFIDIWKEYRLFPLPGDFPWYSWIIWAVGLFFYIFFIMIFGTAVSKLTYEQLRGDEFFEVKSAISFAFKHWSSVILSPLIVVAFIGVIFLAGVILGLLGLIPYVGPVIVGLFSILAFFASLFIVYLLIIFIFTITLSPAVVGTTKSDVFDTLFEVFSSFNDQTWRLVWYQFLLLVFSLVGTFILGIFSSLAISVGRFILSLIMKGNINTLIEGGEYFLRVNPAFGDKVYSFLSGMGFGVVFYPPALTFSHIGYLIGQIFMGLTFYAIFFFILGYGLSIWFSGNVIAYTVIVKKKDNKNLLEMYEEEEAEIIKPIEEKKEEEKSPESKTEKEEKKAKKTTRRVKKTTTKAKTSKGRKKATKK